MRLINIGKRKRNERPNKHNQTGSSANPCSSSVTGQKKL